MAISLDDQLKGLLKEVKKEKKRKKLEAAEVAKPKREVPSRLPDAVVLILFESKCIKCGATHESHNKRLLLRFGNDLMRPKKWIYAYSKAPREILKRAEIVEACVECFEGGEFPLYVINEKERTF